MVRAAILDIDGTLLRAGDRDHTAAMERAVSETFDVSASLDGIPLGGNLDRAIASTSAANAGVSQERIAASVDDALTLAGAYYSAAVGSNSRRSWILPGVLATLERLVSAGVQLGIVSGNAETIGWHKLGAAGLIDYFGFGAWGSEHGSRAELVTRALERSGAERRAAVLIGDTPRDIEAAVGAGVRCLAVATGRFSMAHLDEADEAIPDLRRASALLDDLRMVG